MPLLGLVVIFVDKRAERSKSAIIIAKNSSFQGSVILDSEIQYVELSQFRALFKNLINRMEEGVDFLSDFFTVMICFRLRSSKTP